MKRMLIVLVVPALAAACGHSTVEPRKPEAAAVPVPVIEVRRTQVPEYIEAGGVLSSRETALVSSRIMAPVVRVLVAPGDRIRAGQPLVQLDDRALSADQARAAAAARAAEHGRRGADAEIAAARATLDLAQTTYNRVARLHDRRSATDNELDQAAAALAAARSRLEQATAGASQAEATLESSTAAATAAGVSRSWATITAPFAGVVTEKLVEPGNMALPGAPLLRVETAGRPRLEVRVDAWRAVQVHPGDAVSIVVESRDGKGPTEVTGRVAEISRAVSAGAQTLLVKIDLPEATPAASGTFARARFRGRERTALAVPRTALTRHGQLTSVFVVDGDRSRLRLVTTGSESQDLVEITAGLAEGERVVQAPPATLADGVRVAAARATSAQPASAAGGRQ